MRFRRFWLYPATVRVRRGFDAAHNWAKQHRDGLKEARDWVVALATVISMVIAAAGLYLTWLALHPR